MAFVQRLFCFALLVSLLCLLAAPILAQEDSQGSDDQPEVISPAPESPAGEGMVEPEVGVPPTNTDTPTPEVSPKPPGTPRPSQTEQASSSCPMLNWDLKTWQPEHSSAGTRVTFDEITRARLASDSLTTVGYRVGVTGVPSGTTLCLFTRRLGQASQLAMSALRVNDAGALVSPNGQEVRFTLSGFVKGEPLDIALVAPDGSLKIFSTLIPFPIQATGMNNCRLATVLRSSDGTLFEISGAGFEPNEKLDGFSQSESEQLSSKLQAGADGTWRVIMLPAVIGKSGGTASFETFGQKCTLKVTYDWGSALTVQ